jgi:hypothetical protein
MSFVPGGTNRTGVLLPSVIIFVPGVAEPSLESLPVIVKWFERLFVIVIFYPYCLSAIGY